MKTSVVLSSLLASSAGVHGFPAMAGGADGVESRELNIENFPEFLSVKEERERLAKRAVTFDAKAQYVSNTGKHKFVPPNFKAGDQRGPCPGLNAAANHGYIDHSGVDTWTGIYNGVQKAYGMSADLAGFLALFGTVFDGNPLSTHPGYSIGGPSAKAQNILGNVGGLLGSAQGLSGSHNKYESDTSPTRGDQYVFGDAYRVQTKYAQEYVDVTPKKPIASDVYYQNIFPYRQSRYNDSYYGNPNFFYSPFSGVLVSPAGFAFPKAMMANHSAEYPEGYMTKDILRSFFAVAKGTSKAVKYTEGHEKIPDNWYRRAFGDEYSIPGFLIDVLDYAGKDPRLLNVGGNLGKGGDFSPVDLSNLTGGVFNTADLLKGNNLECFTLQIVQAAAPDVLGGGITESKMFGLLGQTILTSLAGLGCPQLRKIDNSLYDKYPGYNKTQGAV